MAVPDTVLTNQDLEAIVETTDEWIQARTGIKERRIADEHESTATLGLKAAQRALEVANVLPLELDLIVVATSTPEHIFPSTASIIQDWLGANKAGAFDLSAACAGFVYALNMAAQSVRSGSIQTALVIGSETMTRVLDWQDRGTCILFGDGAGAVVVRAWKGVGTNADRGILGCPIHSDGRYCDKLYVDGGPSTTKTVGHLRMEGREVFKHAVINIATVMDEAITKAGLKPMDIDWFVPHQANRRILEGTVKRLGVPEDRIVMTLDRHGNTSAASIPLAFDVAVKDGRIKRGQLVLMEAMGGGFTWGAVLARF
jgi:3-oxoacyl-[acyl-carrier-protein] synthase-3